MSGAHFLANPVAFLSVALVVKKEKEKKEKEAKEAAKKKEKEDKKVEKEKEKERLKKEKEDKKKDKGKKDLSITVDDIPKDDDSPLSPTGETAEVCQPYF